MKKTFLLSAVLCAGLISFAQTQLFYESFDKCLNDDELYDGFTGGNDDQWGGNVATELVVFTDNSDWTFDNVYGANQCIKLGTSDSQQGKATTPQITCSGDVTLTFRAAPWNEDKTNVVTVSVKGGTADKGVFELEKHWNDLTVKITDITEGITITFSTLQKKHRVFLDEIKVVSAPADAAAIRVQSGNTIDMGYRGRYYDAAKYEVEVKGENLSAAGITASIESDAYNMFSISPSTLPAAGGIITLNCKAGAAPGSYNAYLVLSATSKNNSSEKVEKKVPIEIEISDLDLQGSGTIDDPYTVADRLLLAANDGTVWAEVKYWVTGYILGAVKRYNDKYDGICTNDKTSLVIADSPDETNENKIVTVQITSDARAALNVVDNPENIGKKVKVQGILRTSSNSALYLGKPGVMEVKNKDQYVIVDETITQIELSTELRTDLPMYDLLGRRVGQDYKGVVIQNGNKFLVK